MYYIRNDVILNERLKRRLTRIVMRQSINELIFIFSSFIFNNADIYHLVTIYKASGKRYGN